MRCDRGRRDLPSVPCLRYTRAVGFEQEKKRFLAALAAQDYLVETRGAQQLKNWLISDKELSSGEAFDIVNATRGNQARLEQHHQDPNQPIWILRPAWNLRRWYIKCYVDQQTDIVYFLSFHPSEEHS